MSLSDYVEARKLGKKEYKYCVSIGRSPYLPVLDEILSNEQVQTEQYMGLLNIPLEFVVGTATAGRTKAFAANFMPILDESSEFSFKWEVLSDAQVNEGIRDPIKVYEYMNRYYVVEGNKRVSVMKYFGAGAIPAVVTRKIPKLTDDPEVKLYYEFMDFNKATGLNTIEFSVYGSAQKLLDHVNAPTPWNEQTLEEFNRVVFTFNKAFVAQGGQKLNLKLGDALVAFLNVYGYGAACEMNEALFNTSIQKCWNEITNMAEHFQVDLVMSPTEVKEKKGLFGLFAPSAKTTTVAFLYPKAPDKSDWIYAHELGRHYLEETFPDTIKTIRVDDVSPSNVVNVLEDVIADGATIIFEVAPQLMEESLKVAVEYPQVTILNCSLNAPHKYIRTYYARMYEAKFLAGMIAGALAQNDKIAYIADYPIYGMIANINAFAYGTSCVNPRAKVYLDWSTRKDYNFEKLMEEHQIHIVSDQDMITPTDPSRSFGLYAYDVDVERKNLVMPIWNWGVFYEKLIQSILSGTFDSEEWDERRPLNYWWGMSAGVIDLIASKNVPVPVATLIDHMRNDICQGEIQVFSGEIRDQNGKLRNKKGHKMKPADIMNMDWLAENVIGSLPNMEDLIDGAKTVVEIKGVEA
ncbi:MAG: BMP family ABC transporter substrate-binding protein [Lachnospiraceae bacterium]|nr:BMP family ABC transporter substrate-binding protein [Lachnospiraceae bacterium]